MKHDFAAICKRIVEQYTLPLNGIHGVVHWARVYENGMRLAESSAAKIEVVCLFALFHDSRRFNESTDPDHGQRGADFAAELRGELVHLSDDDFELLYEACVGHTHELTHENSTIQTCWDSDRLDLGRVGVEPHPAYLSTKLAKHPDTIRWADGRATSGFVPDLIQVQWEIDL